MGTREPMALELGQNRGLTGVLSRVRRWNEALNDRYFGKSLNGTQAYKQLAKEACEKADTILHLGSGRDKTGTFDTECYGRLTVLALDPDLTTLRDNVSRFRVQAIGDALPLKGESVDIVCSDYVFEHLGHPLEVLKQCARVLRPGGKIIIVTPNVASYFGVLSRLTPFWFHRWFLRWLLAKPTEDTFPTCYRFNTRQDVRYIAEEANLGVSYLELFAGPPIYSTWLPGIHLLFIAMHKLLENSLLRRWSLRIVTVLEKRLEP